MNRKMVYSLLVVMLLIVAVSFFAGWTVAIRFVEEQKELYLDLDEAHAGLLAKHRDLQDDHIELLFKHRHLQDQYLDLLRKYLALLDELMPDGEKESQGSDL